MARRKKRTAEPPQPEVSNPSRYIARVARRTGQEVPGDFEPDELLVHAHRDKHPLEVGAQFLASRLIQLTGKEEAVNEVLRLVETVGGRVARLAGLVAGSAGLEEKARRLLGVTRRDVFFRFRETTHLAEKDVKARIERLQREARAALRARGRSPRLHVLLTGATGFLGKEILSQAAGDRRIERVTAVVRPETIRDKAGNVLKVLSPAQRGALLLQRLRIGSPRTKKFRFIEGDIEKPDLGVARHELDALRSSLTHVIHCAASVAFDDPYEASFRANVLGCRNALAFSHDVQRTPGSPFVSHVAIETSYIHGRKRRSIASEHALVFPRHFYNNFYELTKAMASIETDRALVEQGVRVAQLLPSIVIGHSRTGNNFGDTKVVNAPINAFGRAGEAVRKAGADPLARAKAWMIAAAAARFPGDPSAELNLVPVDRVVQGILAALTVPEAIGRRIHLATDNRIRSQDMVRVCREELGVSVRLADPTLHRNVTMPVLTAVLEKLGEPKLANALERLAAIFGGYGEWGQPIHDVGNDVRVLGLPIRRPNTEHAFRMLCRHNKLVQDFGRVRDPDEIARREHVWVQAVDRLEQRTGHEVGAICAEHFREMFAEEVDPKTLRLRAPTAGDRKGSRSHRRPASAPASAADAVATPRAAAAASANPS